MQNLLAFLLLIAFSLLALVHVYWACGGQKGASIAVPERPSRSGSLTMEKAFQPGKVTTLAVALALIAVAAMVAVRSGMFGISIGHTGLDIVRLALALVAIAMLLRAIGEFRLVGFFKKIRGTPFARMDTLLYSPLCCALGLGLAILAL